MITRSRLGQNVMQNLLLGTIIHVGLAPYAPGGATRDRERKALV